MTVWSKGISWSKMKLALECPLQLQKTIEREPCVEFRPNYYMQLGTVVQKVYELYFNQQINLRPGGDREEVVGRCAQKVMGSDWFKNLGVSYPTGFDSVRMQESVMRHVKNGFVQLRDLGLLEKAVRSEVDWGATFRAFRIFGRMDFVVRENAIGVYLYDGKSNQEKSADVRQLLYYALVAYASGQKVLGGGFLYWQLDYEKVDLSAKAVKKFVDEDWGRGAKVFEQLKRGVGTLPAVPEAKRCYFCSWGRTCEFSASAREPVDHLAPTSVSFGENQ